MAHPKVVIVGGGIAGLSLAARLPDAGSVTVLESELQPGYHSSGRSAAVSLEPYINATILELTRASRDYHLANGATPVDSVMIADDASADLIDAQLTKWGALCPAMRESSPEHALSVLPVLNPSGVHRVLVDPTAMHLDAHGLLDGFRRAFTGAGGTVINNTRVTAIERKGAAWTVRADDRRFDADVVVNAAGAWADPVAEVAGVPALGLQPLRRTGVLVDLGIDVRGWPLAHRADGTLYFKAEAGLLMLSPSDATPSPPCDAQADEWDVAVAVDRFQHTTTITDVRPAQTWAGLRTFMPDSVPAVGFDDRHDGFFWLAGQGGFGMQTSPALSEVAAGLLTGNPSVWADRLAPNRAVEPG